MNKKIIAILVGIVIIGIVGLLAYFAWNNSSTSVVSNNPDTTTEPVTDTPTPNDSQTRTYKNTEQGIEFMYPATYRNSTAERSSNVPIVTLEKNDNSNSYIDNSIVVKSIVPKSGQSYQQAIIEDVIFDGSGDHPKSFAEFKSRIINGKTYHWIVTGRFEAVVGVNYYLQRENDILVFTSTSHDVLEWTDPNFNVENDVTHTDLRTILGSLKLSTPQGSKIKLYFVNPTSDAFKTSCGATEEIIRSIPKTVAVADAALRELFKGPTTAEKSRGLEMSAKLADYNSIIVRNGVATVDFKQSALVYLNGAACMQESVKGPIEQTLKQFPSIKSVNYSINGTVFTEWDA